jgi:hypothetical protein
MTLKEQDIIHALDGIKSVDDIDDLKRLEELAKQLNEFGASEDIVRAFLGVFERFPVDDAYGIFWSILHGLEKSPNYEFALIESLQRQPAEFSLLMVKRILNSGKKQIGDTDLLALLKGIAEDRTQAQEIQEQAKQFINGL